MFFKKIGKQLHFSENPCAKMLKDANIVKNHYVLHENFIKTMYILFCFPNVLCISCQQPLILFCISAGKRVKNERVKHIEISNPYNIRLRIIFC